jgi:hypothetical protein
VSAVNLHRRLRRAAPPSAPELAHPERHPDGMRTLALLVGALGSAIAVVLPAQTASGRVLGFDGEPARAAVRGVDAKGRNLAEELAGDDGTFQLVATTPIVRLIVQLEGVVLERAVDGGGVAGVEVTFAGVPHTALRGSVVDPGGEPARARDLLFRDAAGKAVVTATTDGDGAFVVRTNQALHDVLVDPLGWRHVQRGPWSAAAPVVLDLRPARDRFHRLHGRVRDDTGAAAAGWRVHANGESRRVATTTTGADGTFALWVRETVRSVEASATVPRLGRLGPWRSDAELELDERTDALVLVTGRFVDGAGAPIVGALLLASHENAPPKKKSAVLGGTDRDGRFAVRLVRGTPFLFVVAEHRHQALGAVPADGTPLLLRAK